MNTRLFCRVQSYHKALFLTYSFDPLFFEQLVLPDLWAGRSSDILVLGDQAQIEASLQTATGQLWHLGSHYLLASANHAGAFHPKVFLRLGPNDGIVHVGSGNVTSAGWGGNHELGTAWMVGPEHADKGSWLHPFLDSVMSWCDGELERTAVLRMKDVPWLSLTPSEPSTESFVLHSHQQKSLAQSITQRWAGRRFHEVKIFTGSTDESGAFLRWAHSTFGIEQATIALTPSAASFDVKKLSDLPIKLRIIPVQEDRVMHAKFYWFDGANGAACAMGSANCSAAAWLLSPHQGGNIETLVVYDQPANDDFAELLEIFDAHTSDPVDVLLPRTSTVTESVADAQRFRLRSLSWESADLRLQAKISPAPEHDMRLELVISGSRYSMQALSNAEGVWACNLPEQSNSGTLFARVEIFRASEQWTTQLMWVNDVVRLEHSSQTARFLEPFKGLEQSTTSKEQQQILQELQEVAQALFTDTSSFCDPEIRTTYAQKALDDMPTSPVNPADLIAHLENTDEALSNFSFSGVRPTLSLRGILRVLFEAENGNSDDVVAINDVQIDEDTFVGDAQSDSQYISKNITKADTFSLIEERFRDRLVLQISSFLTEIDSSEFAERCSVTQMVQAVAFPLAIAIRGKRRGWVTPDVAEQWALEVFSILFRGKTSKIGGLLHAVEQRYANTQRRSIFEEVAGNGTLWMVLVASLGSATWQGIGAYMDKALALREVFTARQLLSSLESTTVTALIRGIRIDDARSYILEVAPQITQLLEKIEFDLTRIWEIELKQQCELGVTHKAGDLIWRKNVGWAICLENSISQTIQVRLRGRKVEVMSDYYVNVSELMHRHNLIKENISQLRHSLLSK